MGRVGRSLDRSLHGKAENTGSLHGAGRHLLAEDGRTVLSMPGFIVLDYLLHKPVLIPWGKVVKSVKCTEFSSCRKSVGEAFILHFQLDQGTASSPGCLDTVYEC